MWLVHLLSLLVFYASHRGRVHMTRVWKFLLADCNCRSQTGFEALLPLGQVGRTSQSQHRGDELLLQAFNIPASRWRLARLNDHVLTGKIRRTSSAIMRWDRGKLDPGCITPFPFSRGEALLLLGLLAGLPDSAKAALLQSSNRKLRVADPAVPRLSPPREPVRILHITDNHISLVDDDPPRTTRMFKAFEHTTDFFKRTPTTPQEEFELLLQKARDEHIDLIALGGDLVNYPSPSTVAWTVQKLKETGIPYIYTAGNHDWHEEGVADLQYDSARLPQLKSTLSPRSEERR